MLICSTGIGDLSADIGGSGARQLRKMKIKNICHTLGLSRCIFYNSYVGSSDENTFGLPRLLSNRRLLEAISVWSDNWLANAWLDAKKNLRRPYGTDVVRMSHCDQHRLAWTCQTLLTEVIMSPKGFNSFSELSDPRTPSRLSWDKHARSASLGKVWITLELVTNVIFSVFAVGSSSKQRWRPFTVTLNKHVLVRGCLLSAYIRAY